MAVVLPFILLGGLLYAAGHGQQTEGETVHQPMPVQAGHLQLQDSYEVERLALAKVESPNLAQVGFELSGKVKTLYRDEGEQVNAGELLAQLDTARIDAELMQLKASLERTRADARLAALTEQRVAQLVARKLDSAQRLDEAKEALAAAQARVKETEAGVARLQVELEKSRILAPFSGTLTSRRVDEGTVVAAGTPVFTLQQASGLEARLALGAQDASALTVGQKVTMYRQGEIFDGIVKSIGRHRALDTRTLDVMVSLDDQSSLLVPGDLLEFKLHKKVNQRGAWVPRQALSTGVRGLWNLYLLEQVEQNHRIRPQLVEVLHLEQDRAFVSGALADNTPLVLNGTQRLVPGQLVSVQGFTDVLAMTTGDGHE
ncbi:efflux RND transporter periplasmic adaptor subunit [Aliiglaciecola sp. CAU 1673]|uniref:efflux RND transporter periplasmic adaptor subunit n=1 Tax=Aliiglaciecola sp. CAU 1673 TaxID=3032595 RepID=UPI0023DBDB87|nr:efflux RND transporter periplasmic adaptor subunit [Aliiglaciecola sp. CAU 1673]MDF2176661.1 efflux RND transporter periplasmic adaptor subunit [Aliiglaciecola sp. CAU 1673]